jgi:branched-chain amino acid transport system permease protein
VKQRQIVAGVLVAAALVAVASANWAGNDVSLRSLEQLLVFALPTAAIYALAATGLVVVYTTTGVFNFAQGAIGMLAAFVYWQLKVDWGYPTWVSVVLTVFVFAPVFGIVLERVIMRHLAGKDLVVQLMVTVGLLLGFIGVANTIWDPNAGHSVPAFFGIDGFKIAGVVLTWHRLIALMVALALVIGLRFLLYTTRAGIAMRAVVDNRGLAALNGVPASRVSMLAWALGSTLAALAGVLIANVTDMSAGGSLTLATLVPAFAAAAVGRMRSLPLTYLGALLLGLFIQFSSEYLSWGGRWAQVPDRIPEIMLFVVLLMLPAANLRFARISYVRRHGGVTRPWRAAIGLAVLAVAVPVVGGWLGGANLSRLCLGMSLGLIALSLVPLTGWAGQVSFAPLAFAGVGAAAFGHWGGQHGHPWAILLAALAAAPVGAALSLVAGRLQGLYLGLATFAFAYVARYVILDQPFAFAGQTLNTPRPHYFGVSFTGNRAYLTLLTVVFGLVGFALVVLRSHAFGRRLIALRDSEAAAATVGVNLFETKVAVFTLSAMIAGLGGAFYAMFNVNTAAGNFEALAGLGLVLQMVVGGILLVSGAVFAGLFQLPIQILQDHVDSRWIRGLQQIAPGFAALGIIQNPDGAVVAIADGFAPLIPGRTSQRAERSKRARARRAAAAALEAQAPQLGLTSPYTREAIAEVERRLGVAGDLVPGRR